MCRSTLRILLFLTIAALACVSRTMHVRARIVRPRLFSMRRFFPHRLKLPDRPPLPPVWYAELPGVRLWFVDTGGAGQVVILLHANTGTSVPAKQLRAFSEADYRVIAFDRRGWGKSIANPGTGPQPGTVTEDMQNLAEYLGLDRFNLVGVAGGGFVVLDYAAWHPERVIDYGGCRQRRIDTRQRDSDFDARIQIPGFTSLPMQYQVRSPVVLLARIPAARRNGSTSKNMRSNPACTVAADAESQYVREAGED